MKSSGWRGVGIQMCDSWGFDSHLVELNIVIFPTLVLRQTATLGAATQHAMFKELRTRSPSPDSLCLSCPFVNKEKETRKCFCLVSLKLTYYCLKGRQAVFFLHVINTNFDIIGSITRCASLGGWAMGDIEQFTMYLIIIKSSWSRLFSFIDLFL